MNIIEFLKANWGTLVPILAISGVMWGVIAKYFEIKERLSKLETRMEMLTTLYPQLKSLEKLENFEKLSPDDIRKTVSEILKMTNITPEAIDLRIEEKIEKKLSDIDKGIATMVAQKLNQIDKQFGQSVGDVSDYLRLGNAEDDKGNYQKAIEYYNKAIELKSDFALAWLNKGVALGRLNRSGEALKAFDKAIELKPNYAEAWYNKGVVLGKLGRPPEEALKAYDKAIEIKPDYAKAWNNKGVTLGILGRPEEELKAYDKAIEIKPDYADAWCNKGVALGKLGRYPEALKAYEKTIELKPDYAATWYNIACAYSLKGEKENALKSLSKAIKLDAKYKEDAKKDKDFKSLWNDEDFKKIIS